MNKIRINVDRVVYIFSFAILAILYLLHAPYTVQTGDSGELSAAAYKLLVAHPPGYPFWIWLNHFWLKIVSLNTTYFTLAAFNILCSLITLWLISRCIPNTRAKIITILSLGFGYAYWKFSLLPEVFILNLLLAFAVVYTGNIDKVWSKLRIPVAPTLMPIFFSVGIANHHTIIFLIPYVAWVCWKHKKSPWLYLSISSGILICSGLYFSLLSMHPEHVYSWGNLKTINDIWNHFLRKDYGTFALTPYPSENSTSLLLVFLLEHTLLTVTPLLVLSAASLIQINNRKIFVWSTFNSAVSFCVLSYVLIFIPMMKMTPIYAREETTERFLLLPISLIALILGKFVSDNYDFNNKTNSTAAYAFVTLFISFSFSMFSYDLDYSKNTILSDYSRNILHIAAEFNNPVLMINQDAQSFSTRYTQIVEQIEPQVYIAENFNALAQLKTAKGFPSLQFKPAPRNENWLQNVIKSNEQQITFVVDEDEFPPEIVKLTYLPLGVIVSSGKGVEFLKTKYTPQFRSDVSIINKPYMKFDLYRNVFSKYSYFFIAKGMTEAKLGNLALAIDSFERALGLAPFSKQALANLCKLKSNLKIDDVKCSRLAESEMWFDYLKFNKGR